MKQPHTILPCGFHEEALIAAALDEADATLQHAVQAHTRQCQACRRLFDTYQSLQQVFTTLQDTSAMEAALRQAGERLAQRLVPKPVVRLAYRYFTSAVGELCIAQSAQGVPLLAWQTHAAPLLATLKVQEGVEVQEDGAALQALVAELQAYLAGTRERLEWPIDERLMRSSFQRQVLQVTAGIPYGAVMSYQGVAAAIGQPKAVRAVAQALRRNPLAIVIPCHRVVGRTGHLTGYAGGLERKQALLAHEGVPLQTRSAGVFIDQERMYIGWRTERYYCQPHCPSLAAITPDDMLFLSSRVVATRAEFAPCAVCRPEVALTC
jgi:O-6-methylguanine DNA methyltransferase